MNDWNDAELRVERARDLYEEGQWVEAADELQAAIDINPYNPSWYFNLALTLEAMEKYARACECYEQALELDAGDMEAMNCLGVNLTRLGRYADALKRFKTIEKLNPKYEPSYCNRIITYTEMGDHDQAELMFYLARQIKSECPLCCYNIGNSLYARGLYNQAIDCWRQALRLEPTHPEAHVRIAEACWAKGDLKGARRHYEIELELSPDDLETLLDLGELLMEQGHLDEAAARFQRVLDTEGDHTGALFCLGELAVRKTDLGEAEHFFHRVLQIDASYGGAHAKLARIFMLTGRSEEAGKHLVAELRGCGNDPSMLQELGQLLLEAHQTRHANKVLKRLVKLAPKDPYAQHNLAVSFFKMDRIDDGIRHCRRALKLKPKYPLALYNLALAHLQKGAIPRARRYAARALTLDPQNEQIVRLSRRLGMGSFWWRLRNRLRTRPNPEVAE